MHKYINSGIAITIYKQLILPLFDYADFMVDCACKSKVDKLEKLQATTLRYVKNDARNSMKIENLCSK